MKKFILVSAALLMSIAGVGAVHATTRSVMNGEIEPSSAGSSVATASESPSSVQAPKSVSSSKRSLSCDDDLSVDRSLPLDVQVMRFETAKSSKCQEYFKSKKK